MKKLTIRRGSSNSDISGVSNTIISRYHSAICPFLVRTGFSALYLSDQTSNTSTVYVGQGFRAASIDFGNETKGRVLVALLDGCGIYCCCG